MCWNVKYTFLLFMSTFITYMSGILIEKTNKIKMKKVWVTVSFLLNLSILIFFKYFNFILESINVVLDLLEIQFKFLEYNIILPVGISFYIFQALSYTMDVYRGEIKAEKNMGKYALFVSFFPQLVAGPIERSKNLLNQINNINKFNYKKIKNGFL